MEQPIPRSLSLIRFIWFDFSDYLRDCKSFERSVGTYTAKINFSIPIKYAKRFLKLAWYFRQKARHFTDLFRLQFSKVSRVGRKIVPNKEDLVIATVNQATRKGMLTMSQRTYNMIRKNGVKRKSPVASMNWYRMKQLNGGTVLTPLRPVFLLPLDPWIRLRRTLLGLQSVSKQAYPNVCMPMVSVAIFIERKTA